MTDESRPAGDDNFPEVNTAARAGESAAAAAFQFQR